jgi:hypothetical protein
VKRRKGSGNKRRPTRSWLDRQFRPGFRGYPIATAAFYGPNDKLATKVVVSVFLTESDEPDFLERWFSKGEMDVRDDPAIGEEILTFFKTHAPRSTVVTDACRLDRAQHVRRTCPNNTQVHGRTWVDGGGGISPAISPNDR